MRCLLAALAVALSASAAAVAGDIRILTDPEGAEVAQAGCVAVRCSRCFAKAAFAGIADDKHAGIRAETGCNPVDRIQKRCLFNSQREPVPAGRAYGWCASSKPSGMRAARERRPSTALSASVNPQQQAETLCATRSARTRGKS